MMLPSPINEDGSNSLTQSGLSIESSDLLNASNISASVAHTTTVVSSSNFANVMTNISCGSGNNAIVVSSSNSGTAASEKIMQPPEELPYFPEKFPTKVCALCCLDERSQLGQGEMLRFEFKDIEMKSMSTNSLHELSQLSQEEEKSPRGTPSNTQTQLSNRRQKGLNKCK